MPTRTESVISLGPDILTLSFPRGDFTDTIVAGLVASRSGSTAGDVRVRRWTAAEVAKWDARKRRFDSYGWRVAWVIRRAGRSASGDGLIQRAARKLGVPVVNPPKSSCVVTDCRIDSRGWLDDPTTSGLSFSTPKAAA